MKALAFWGGIALVVIGALSNFAVNQIAQADLSDSNVQVIYGPLAFINNNMIWFVLAGILLLLFGIFA